MGSGSVPTGDGQRPRRRKSAEDRKAELVQAAIRLAARTGPDRVTARDLAREVEADAVATSGSHTYALALAHPGLRDGPWRHQVCPGTIVLCDRRTQAAARDLGLRQAAFVLSRVVARPRPDRLTLDAGTKAIAPACPAPGLAVLGHPELAPATRSEEHLPLDVRGATGLAPGDLVLLVPDHVCTTVNLYREALYVSRRFLSRGKVEAAGRRVWHVPRSARKRRVLH